VTRRFELRFESIDDLEREVGSNLRKGRTFVPGELAPADRSPCVVCVRHPGSGAEVELAGEVVFAQSEGPHVGVGVDLVDADLARRLTELMEPVATPAAAPQSEGESHEAADLVLEAPLAPVEISLDFPEDALGDEAASQDLDNQEARPSSAPDSRRGITVHERVRKLNPAARDKLARTGNLSERVALERAFGASVWEALLEHAQISGAEIAKIAKNGLAPATILSHIAGHAGWLSKPEIRRALLSNPRLPTAQAERVLRSLPPTELRLVPSQAAYPAGIRAAARRLLQR
jgi:hypothetical protein